jgi:hypothetical protein
MVDSIHFLGDQDDHDSMPQEYADHMERALVHAAGHGEHPGRYRGPQHRIRHDEEREDRAEPTEGALARLMEEQGPPDLQARAQKEQAPPPQESVQQPPRDSGGKSGSSKPPTHPTPAALGQEAVAPEPPSGEF